MNHDKSKYYLDLSKCSEGEIKEASALTGYDISLINSFPYLFWNESEWDQCKDDYNIFNKTEISFTAFKDMLVSGEDYPGERYQPLFDHLNSEHGLILHESEMDEIIRIVHELNSNR